MTTSADHALARAHREEWARVVAGLARRFGDLDVAEEAAADAFAVAAERWPCEGVPPNPGGWLATTARRKALDRVRRESQRAHKHEQAALLAGDVTPGSEGPVTDDRLRLLFTCCHPVLSSEARIALTLRLLGGLSVGEIAHAFLVPEATLAQRITRAKATIRDRNIPYRVPDEADLAGRVDSVLTVIYLVFNEGHLTTTGDAPLRQELTAEALRLARLVHELLPDDGEATGLLALLLLLDSRRAARVAADGGLVTLPDQDRSAWDREQVREGLALVRQRLDAVAAGAARPGRFQLLAAINAVHAWAPSAEATDWAQVVALYDQFLVVDPSPVVRLNRAVAVAEWLGADAGLVDLVPLAAALDGYHAFHVTRAELLRRLGDLTGSRAAYDRALALARNPAERTHLERRRAGLGGDTGADTGSPQP